LSRAALLTDIARQLGQTSRPAKSALRSAIDAINVEVRSSDAAKSAGNFESNVTQERIYDPALSLMSWDRSRWPVFGSLHNRFPEKD
jgi:hypothetical protein